MSEKDEQPKVESNWSWQKKLLMGGIISLSVSIGGMQFNNILSEKRNLTDRLLASEKLCIVVNSKVAEMEKYQADLIESMVVSDKVNNEMKVRISFLERAIGLEEYIKYLKSHASMAKQIADSESDDAPEVEAPKPVATAPIYSKPKDLSNMLNQELQQTVEPIPPLLDDVKKERFNQHMKQQKKQ